MGSVDNVLKFHDDRLRTVCAAAVSVEVAIAVHGSLGTIQKKTM